MWRAQLSRHMTQAKIFYDPFNASHSTIHAWVRRNTPVISYFNQAWQWMIRETDANHRAPHFEVEYDWGEEAVSRDLTSLSDAEITTELKSLFEKGKTMRHGPGLQWEEADIIDELDIRQGTADYQG
eukprot:TRINITY_DN6140_c0_g1_i1.p1 TRINITY_DN6140_c0_g1~~TRINITY_DN6140_c0_g1_i1.p1  ORF type:complete len:127 (-),score=20.87 TRINITY_DN6140_c0_g1_i1:20-400(-)